MQLYQIGKCTLNCDNHTLFHDGKSVSLPVKVFELLQLFIVTEQHIVSKELAIKSVWDGNEAVALKAFSNTIWLLRKAFKDLNIEEDTINTISKVGYQLTLPVSEVTPTQQPTKPLINTRSLIGLSFGVLFTVIGLLYWFGSASQQTLKKDYIKVDLTNYEGIEEQAAVSNSGKYLAFMWQRGEESANLYIKDLDRPDSALTLSVSSTDRVVSPAWSINDNYLAYATYSNSGQCHIKIKQLVTHTVQMLDSECYFQPLRRIVNWSQVNEDILIYSKPVGSSVAIFRFDLKTKEKTQLTFPGKNEVHYAPHYSASDESLFYISEKSTAQKISLNMKTGDEVHSIISNKVSIVDLDVDTVGSRIFVNYADRGDFVISAIDYTTGKQELLQSGGLPSNLAFNSVRQSLYLSEHISKEYIAEIRLSDGKIMRKVSSSHRDMYGRYNAKTKDILFLSNRSDYWSVWRNDGITSKNLTEELGNATIPSISPDGQYFAASIRDPETEEVHLYITDPLGKSFKQLDIQGLLAGNLSWSTDSQSVFFQVPDKGIFKVNIHDNNIQQVTFDDEVYLMESPEGELYVSRLNTRGIWLYDPEVRSHTLVTEELEHYDYGSFFFMGDQLVFLKRSDDSDLLVTLEGPELKILHRFEHKSVRQYAGVANASVNSIIATLMLAREADIKEIKI